MEYITFKQFVYTINICNCYENSERELINDNMPIKFSYNEKTQLYIDLGWDDFFNKDACWEKLIETLNENILNSVVTSFRYDTNYNQIVVELSDPKDLESLTICKN